MHPYRTPGDRPQAPIPRFRRATIETLSMFLPLLSNLAVVPIVIFNSYLATALAVCAFVSCQIADHKVTRYLRHLPP